MLIEGLDAASAAFEVGDESASQFNREYKRFLGQPPMQDIKARPLAGSAAASDCESCRTSFSRWVADRVSPPGWLPTCRTCLPRREPKARVTVPRLR
jgi:hypothetical protein